MRKHPLLAFATPTLGLALVASLFNTYDATATTKTSLHPRIATRADNAIRELDSSLPDKRFIRSIGRPGSISSSTPVNFVLPTSVTSSLAPSTSAGDKVWMELRNCESSDNYQENSGNGFYGAYQFTLGSWRATGEAGMPNDAPPTVQDAAAKRLLAIQGWRAWPNCTWVLGLA